jgi:hypothetical protein
MVEQLGEQELCIQEYAHPLERPEHLPYNIIRPMSKADAGYEQAKKNGTVVEYLAALQRAQYDKRYDEARERERQYRDITDPNKNGLKRAAPFVGEVPVVKRERPSGSGASVVPTVDNGPSSERDATPAIIFDSDGLPDLPPGACIAAAPPTPLPAPGKALTEEDLLKCSESAFKRRVESTVEPILRGIYDTLGEFEEVADGEDEHKAIGSLREQLSSLQFAIEQLRSWQMSDVRKRFAEHSARLDALEEALSPKYGKVERAGRLAATAYNMARSAFYYVFANNAPSTPQWIDPACWRDERVFGTKGWELGPPLDGGGGGS